MVPSGLVGLSSGRDGGHTETDLTGHAGELAFGCGDADLQSFYLAEPAAFVDFVQALAEIDRTSRAGMLMSARGSVTAAAGAEFDLAFGEVLVELLPFFRRGVAVLLARAELAAPGEEGAVVAEHVLGIDR
ncbi:hypothetical protein BIV24_15625 [Streptomyces colonosanans]|uniref:Uncharacterized protein n=1 Tax=Streptomyces colonosanans TaxID=1428652 RepID=A0A1S2PD26_9ACTN|nr:hypothetical protein BIV24_15625 [Streptomyces colonosanans]